jgi:hypothetical protein
MDSVLHFTARAASIKMEAIPGMDFLQTIDAKRKITALALCAAIVLGAHSVAHGWYDRTHLAIAKAVGYDRWYNAAGADIAKLKAGSVEGYNHFYNNIEGTDISAEHVLTQVKKYNNPRDARGHLYGAIIGALQAYKKSTREFKYAEHHIAYAVHYVGDLSQPLHNLPNDTFNIQHHNKNDGIVDGEVLEHLEKITARMYPVILKPETFETDLAREIARIANLSRRLGQQLKKENRDMTTEEAYRQLGHSASLLQAILKYLGKIPAY